MPRLSFIDYLKKTLKSKRFAINVIRLVLFMGIIILFLLFTKHIMQVILSIVLIILGSLSKLYKRFTSFSIGFELITFVTLLFLLSFGFWTGIISAFIMLFLSVLLNGRLTLAIYAEMASYIAIAFLSLLFVNIFSMDFSLSAKILVIFFNIISFIIMTLLFKAPVSRGIITVPINIALNYFLINLIGGNLHSFLIS